MSKHDHILHHDDDLPQAAAKTLMDAGEQWTEMRGQIFDALVSFDKPASAYDIADEVSKSRGRRVAANSVYRILDLFVAKNVALRVESANAYIANSHPGCVHDCIFLVCDTCKTATHLDDDSLANSVRAIAQKVNFNPVRPVIEVRGVCANCG
jgi:Fur family transcriptional regulator, zinc uptake regulator